MLVQGVQRQGGLFQFLRQRTGLAAGVLHQTPSLVGQGRGVARGVRRMVGVAGDLGHGGAHLVHRGGHLVQVLVLARHLVAGAERLLQGLGHVLVGLCRAALDVRQQTADVLAHPLVASDDAADLVVRMARRQGMGEVRRADLGQRHFQPTQLPHQRRQAELPAEHHQHQDRQQATEGDPHLGVLDTVGARAHQRDQFVQLAQQLGGILREAAQVDLAGRLCHLVEHGPVAAPDLRHLLPLGGDLRRAHPAHVALGIARIQVGGRAFVLGDGRGQGLWVAGAESQLQRLAGHLLAEHALRAGHVDGFRRDRHAQVQRHRGAGGQAEHQCIGQQELGVQGLQPEPP